MTSVVVRTIIVYIILSFSLRIMGKRQLGELDVGELVSTLLISEIASIPIDDPDIPLLNAIIPILLIISLEILLSTVKNKSEKLKKVVEGKPEYIIYKGRLLQSRLRDNRISVNELLSEMRSQGVGDIDEIYYAAIEQNGTLSLIKKDSPPLAHAIIIDGNFLESNMRALGLTRDDIDMMLCEKGVLSDGVFLMTITDGGKTNIFLKDDEK